MPIADNTIRAVRYPPELLPDAWVGNVPVAAEVVPPVLDLRRFSPYLVTLTGINVIPSANVFLRTRADDLRLEEVTSAMARDVVAPVAGVTPALPGAWWLTGKQYLWLNLLGVAATVGYPMSYSVWAQKPTVAQKLVYAISLTPEEQEIADRLGVKDTVEKGLLPLPISQQLEREYHVLSEETRSRSVGIAVAATDYAIESIYPRADEVIVLTRVAAAPGTVAQAVQLIIDRDGQDNYLTFPVYPLSLIWGGEIPCFIPATSEIRLHTIATVAPGAYLFRYTFKRIRLTNILRARFGLASPDELPGDTWSKVMAGIL